MSSASVDSIALRLPTDLIVNTSGWFFFCWFFHCLTAIVVKPNWPRFAIKEKYIRWSFYNRTVAMIHSCVMFWLTARYYYSINPGYDVTVPNDEGDTWVAMSNDFMVSYLLYDLSHEIYFTEKPDKETLLHHVLGLMTHTSARCLGSRIAGIYYMMVYVAELSTPFLHLCWGMYAMGFKDHWSFNVVCMIVLASYLLVRIIWGPYLFYHCYINRSAWSSAADQYLYLPNIVILFVFNVLNMVWYKALLVKFLGLDPRGKRNKSDPEDGTIDEVEDVETIHSTDSEVVIPSSSSNAKKPKKDKNKTGRAVAAALTSAFAAPKSKSRSRSKSTSAKHMKSS